MRKWILRLALVLLAVWACLELSHWGDRRMSLVSENTEAILNRTPELLITETERALMEELFQCDSVQRQMESGENGDLKVSEYPEIAAVLEGHLGERTLEDANVGVMSQTVFLSWGEDAGEITTMEMIGSGETPEFFKVYARNSFLGTRSCYENWDNERVRQMLVHHWWFSWFLNP